ncbi:MAG: hypothetical protein IT410_02005 [Candidatus Doudnabacteria bacterium]|nr:hypothetical protein [Candidatus Doudnabacteria bacterium]
MKIRLAVSVALLVALTLAFPLLSKAQSSQQPNHDGQQKDCTIYSKVVEHAPDLTLAHVKSTEVGTEIQFNRRVTVRFGVREEKRFAPGTLVQPFTHRSVVMTINWH